MRSFWKKKAWLYHVAALISVGILIAAPCFAAPQIPGFYGTLPNLTPPAPTVVPQLKGIVQGVTNVLHDPTQNKLTVNQEQAKAILDWHSFDIGDQAWTHFNQQGNKDWAALNRIYDQNPTQIYGKLTSHGQLFLINRNGILFGPGSKVNVHSLIASSLNIKNEDFIDGMLQFGFENYGNPTESVDSNGTVSNHGLIETDELGSVFLLGPRVENSGDILSPVGQIGLAAGDEVELTPWAPFPGSQSSEVRSALIVNAAKGGAGVAENLEKGWMIADLGLVGMYGRVVNQEGVIRSITAVKKRGEIELLASEKVTTGPRSVTSVDISSSQEKVSATFEFKPGRIRIRGLESDVDLEDPSIIDPVASVEHRGTMAAPSGKISIVAGDRVFLESGSRVDVSGEWVDTEGEANLVETQLNSVQLRDDYGQKEGLLKGQKIKYDTFLGSALGDISGSLTTQEVNALEQATKGGEAEIWAGGGDIVVKKGAEVGFSGGGIKFGKGHLDTTKLLSGREIYDISEAPEWISYDKIMGLHETVYERFGVTEGFQGLYTGGANALRNFSSRRIEGEDAGRLALVAGRIVLDGDLDGSVTKGLYQTEEAEPVNDLGKQTARGKKEPKAGSLVMGYADPSGSTILRDYLLGDVRIQPDTDPLPSHFAPGDALPGVGANARSTSFLSARTLNAAELDTLTIYSNFGLTIDPDGQVNLAAGGSFVATARAIKHGGEISVPAGRISMVAGENKTSDPGASNYIPLAGDGRIFLAAGSKLSAAGRRIDNFLVGKDAGRIEQSGRLEGGSISLDAGWFDTHGVIMKSGSVIDVSGGYSIDSHGRVSGGDSGSASLQGPTLLLDGDLRAQSLVGKEGGTLLLRAERSAIQASTPIAPPSLAFDSPLPVDLVGTLRLGKDRLEDTGFTSLEIRSVYDLVVLEEVSLSPSRAKMATPVPILGGPKAGSVRNQVAGAEWSNGNGESILKVSLNYIGPSSISLKAGVDLIEGFGANDSSLVELQRSVSLGVGPVGTIRMEGPGLLLAGSLDAPAGKIDLKASQLDLVLKGSARIRAQGYNSPDSKPVIARYPVGYTPLAGGDVKLEATSRNIVLEPGSLVDVSGSAPVSTFVTSSSGMPEKFTVAGEPGGITLIYLNNLDLGGVLSAQARLAGLGGGSLAVSKQDTVQMLEVSAQDIDRFSRQGFDEMRFGSKKGLRLTGDMDLQIGRSLTLDAPQIEAQGTSEISLAAPWIRISNDPQKYDINDNAYSLIPVAATPGESRLTLRGRWIDIEGSLVLSGFENVVLEAQRDIRVSDRFYTGAGSRWEGKLKAGDDMQMSAALIYPETLSAFTMDSAGKVTILPAEIKPEQIIPSAGGTLSITANEIEQRGFLAAPLGSLQLIGKGADSRVALEEGSVTTTAGTMPVRLGELNGEFWQVPDRPTSTQLGDLDGTPQKTIQIDAETALVKEGAVLEISGGGSIFSYQFLPSPDGSSDPLEKPGCYVILPSSPLLLPGDGVYLAGGAGLTAGTYSLLPAEYAFVPGALILTDLSKAGQSYVINQGTSQEGYALVKGYSTVLGTDIHSPNPKGFSVRPAKDVLKEGFFDLRELPAGDAGAFWLSGNTTLLDGTLKASALKGYRGGSVSLSADRINVGRGAAVPGTFVWNPDVLKGLDLEEINLGFDPGAADPQNRVIADSVTIEGGSVLSASRVTVGGKEEVMLKSGAEIQAVSQDGNGIASLVAPDGKVVLEENALVHASHRVNLDVKDIDLRGDIQVENSVISLKGAKIFFVPETYVRTEPGLYLTQSRWDRFSLFEEVELKSSSDLLFLRDFNLSVASSLSIDAARIAAAPEKPGGTSAWTVSIASQKISLLNTGTGSTVDSQADTGAIALYAASEMLIGHGDVRLDGFSGVDLVSGGKVTFKGKGSLTLGGADLSITAPRVTTSYYSNGTTNYEAARYAVNGGNGALRINKGPGMAGQGTAPGGLLEITGRTIDLSTILEVNSGQVRFNASGAGASEGIFLREGAQILARGGDYAPKGSVHLKTEQGALSIAAGALIDVSAGSQGDAGNVSLYAPLGGVSLDGTLLGQASGGQGGSFEMDTNRISDLSSLNTLLSAGGFTQTIDLRARTGNVTIGPGRKVASREFRLTADQGNLSVYGEIDASGTSGGGWVELYAGNLLFLYPEARIYAKGLGAGASGGHVVLSTDQGYVSTLSGSVVDLSGGDGGAGGTVTIRAPHYESSEVFVLPFGTIKGSESVLVEAFKAYSYTGNKNITSTDFGTSKASGWWKETDDFMKNASLIENRLLGALTKDGWTDSQLHLLPGIEVRSTGDLTLASDWNLTPWRFGGEPGVLSLKAAGNLTLMSNLTDKNSDNPGPGNRDSWAMNLVAGGDLSSSSFLSAKSGSGTLTIANQKLVYTESAPVRFASGGAMLIERAPVNFQGYSSWGPFLSMPGSLGTFDGSIHGRVAGNLTLQGSAILSATGDLHITVGKDLYLDQRTSHSAIVTFGVKTGDKTYVRGGGGDILLRVQGDVRTRNADTGKDVDLATVPWDFGYKIRRGSATYYDWAASFIIPEREAFTPRPTSPARGIAAMGSGDVKVLVGGDFRAVAGTFGQALFDRRSSAPALAPATLYGEGDLQVSAGGDVEGRFLVTGGFGEVHALGVLGGVDKKESAVLEGFDAIYTATAQGNVYLGSIVNPSLVEQNYKTQERVLYTEGSSARIVSAKGDVFLYGDSPYHQAGTNETVLPGTLEISSGKSVYLLSDLALVPSMTGSLRINAGENVEAGFANAQTRLERKLVMSDMAPSEVYGFHKDNTVSDLFGFTKFSPLPVHATDLLPVQITAGQDIRQLKLFLPKKAELAAGRDIVDLFVRAQNLADGDVTRIFAGRDLWFSTDPKGTSGFDRDAGLEGGGPGTLIVQAGGIIDLGNAESGIRTVGGFYNPALGEKGSSLMVVTGAGGEIIPDELRAFFNDLRDAGIEYSGLLAVGDRQGGRERIREARERIITPFLDGLDRGRDANILMVNSQISTLSGEDDIFIVAGGRLDVGKTTFFTGAGDLQNTGIFTAGGGGINVFSVLDVNVNESRIMSFRGGDITVWSDRGSVNAGRGDKTAISANPPRQVQVEGVGTPTTTDDKYQLRFDPPSVGSGIRTLTYDPDGIEGPLQEPLAGDVYLFAPSGLIDAGEAGIAGRNVILGATEVLNVQNISFSVGSVGVPVASTGAVGIGALAGVSSLTEVSKMTEQAAGMAASRAEAAQQAAKMMEEFTAKWVDVKVIGFE